QPQQGVDDPHRRLGLAADYFALFADRVQQLLGADRLDPPFVGILANGTSGDVNNIDARGQREKRAPYAKMREVADAVAAAVVKAHAKVPFHDWVPLAARQKELSLATRKPTPEQVARAREILARPDRDAAQASKSCRCEARRKVRPSRITASPGAVVWRW